LSKKRLAKTHYEPQQPYQPSPWSFVELARMKEGPKSNALEDPLETRYLPPRELPPPLPLRAW
jgi:hypothetical protein